jgi:Mrp family chromosome partitioning ATPase
LLIAHFGKATAKEIEVLAQRLAQAGVDVKGVILNAVEKPSAIIATDITTTAIKVKKLKKH